ncbi:MAG: DUF547 domain-containing protein [Planctomycetota bacterium]|jgi:hypothetical protein
MQDSRKLLTPVLVSIACAILTSAAPAVEPNSAAFDYKDYAAALKTYVDANGMVNYEKLKAKPDSLNSFLTGMASIGPERYEKWPDKDKIAFWLNAYNALTLKAIIDNYPIKSSFFRSRVYPKNSIRQIPGVWDKITFTVIRQDLTLSHIEHQILRKDFNEPAIHMALVCAAMSCPPLRNEPYLAKKLDKQLEDQGRKFLSDPGKFIINHRKAVVYLSTIFKWFADDFVPQYAPEKSLGKHNKKVSAVLSFVASHLKDADKKYILEGKYKVKYLSYDWSLNEQKKTGGKRK